MKTIAFILAVSLAGYLAFNFSPAGQRAKQRMRQNAAAAQSSKAVEQSQQMADDVLVVEFSDMSDLLAKLRRIRTGQQIDIRQVGPDPAPISTGIPCSDKAAIAAYMEKVNREADWLSRNVALEIKRINRIP
jgi:hypothetical protein